MKRFLSVISILILITLLLVGCSKTEKLSVGNDNGKLVGAWILINHDAGTVRYWEFQSDNTFIMCDSVQTSENSTKSYQFYEDAPFDVMRQIYCIDVDEIEKHPYSYTEGHGLEYQISENKIVTLTAENEWYIKFVNKNEFVLTCTEYDTYSEYHGYRLKEALS